MINPGLKGALCSHKTNHLSRYVPFLTCSLSGRTFLAVDELSQVIHFLLSHLFP